MSQKTSTMNSSVVLLERSTFSVTKSHLPRLASSGFECRGMHGPRLMRGAFPLARPAILDVGDNLVAKDIGWRHICFCRGRRIEAHRVAVSTGRGRGDVQYTRLIGITSRTPVHSIGEFVSMIAIPWECIIIQKCFASAFFWLWLGCKDA